MEENNKEYPYEGAHFNGFTMLGLLYVVIPALIVLIFVNVKSSQYPLMTAVSVIVGIGLLICMGGFFVLQPNQSNVMVFFGKYKGTFRETGFYWVNPFLTKRMVSLRIRNLDIEPIKVNDKVGNPVLIGMVLVWKVEDTYKAVFDVDGTDTGSPVSLGLSTSLQLQLNRRIKSSALDSFVATQSDAALREVAGKYPYDANGSHHDTITLRSDTDEISEQLVRKLNERLAMAGAQVVEARLNYLAYAPEIAQVMLRRQQADAIISAREKIVEGAVSMVHMALEKLKEDNVVILNEESKAAMVSNLLVVLCADESATPVLNTSANKG